MTGAIEMTGADLRFANPPRGVPIEMPTLDSARARVPTIPLSGMVSWLARNEPERAARIRGALQGAEAPHDPRLAGEILWCVEDSSFDEEVYDALLVWLAAALGPVGTLEALGSMGALQAQSDKPIVRPMGPFSAHWRALGRVLTLASEEDYAAARAKAAAWRRELAEDRELCVTLAMIFASEPWATEDAKTAVPDVEGAFRAGMLLMANTDAPSAERLIRALCDYWRSPNLTAYPAFALAYRFGAAAEPWLALAHAHAARRTADSGDWAERRILRAVRLLSPALAGKLERPRTIKAKAKVKVKGELRLVGKKSAWAAASREALLAWTTRAWRKGEKLDIAIGTKKIVVRGAMRGATYLFEGKALARAFCLPKDAGISLVGRLVFFEGASQRGMQVINEEDGTQTFELITKDPTADGA